MSRRLKRQIGKAPGGGRGVEPSPRPRAVAGTPLQRLNRILLIGGAGLAVGAVLLALVDKPFKPMALGINLLAIGLSWSYIRARLSGQADTNNVTLP